MRISLSRFLSRQFIDLEKFWRKKLLKFFWEIMDYIDINSSLNLFLWKTQEERNARTYQCWLKNIGKVTVTELLERVTQFRTSGIVNGGVRLLVHCIINNLLNRGLLRIATQRGGQKFRSDPEAFHVKVSAVRYELMPQGRQQGLHTTQYKIFTPSRADEVIERCAIGGTSRFVSAEFAEVWSIHN